MPGFVNRTDIRGTYNTVYYRFRPKKGWLLAWGPSLIQRYVFDHEGNRLDTYYEPYFRIEGRGQTNIYFYPYDELRERLRPQDFAFIGLPGIIHNQDYHEHRSGGRVQTGYFRKSLSGPNMIGVTERTSCPHCDRPAAVPYFHSRDGYGQCIPNVSSRQAVEDRKHLSVRALAGYIAYVPSGFRDAGDRKGNLQRSHCAKQVELAVHASILHARNHAV